MRNGARWPGLWKHLEAKLVQVIQAGGEKGEFRAGEQSRKRVELFPRQPADRGPRGGPASNPKMGQ